MNKISLGCGNKFFPDVNTYLDLYPEDSKERKANPGNIDVPYGKRFIKADIQNMYMIKDKEFDYSYAMNILEHVDNPEMACSEIQRISRAGTIKVPSYFGEIFFGWQYHKWIIIERNETLFFFRKREYENIPFGRYFRERCGKSIKYKHIEVPEIKRVFMGNKKLFDITFEWKGSFKFKVIR